MTSAKGEKISFANILVIFTSNIGADEISSNAKPIGFVKNQTAQTDIMTSVKKVLKPEFINCIDEFVVFNQLNNSDAHKICKLMLIEVKKRAAKLSVKLNFDKSAIAELVNIGYSEEYGARSLKREIATNVENMLADKVLAGEIGLNDNILIKFIENGFVATKNKVATNTEEKHGTINDNYNKGFDVLSINNGGLQWRQHNYLNCVRHIKLA